MKRAFGLFVPTALIFAAMPASALAAWSIDPAHSSVAFKVRHMMVSNVRGEFTKFDGQVTYDPGAPTKSSVSVTIDASSIDTGNKKRDDHLRSSDFFDVAKYPKLTFVSKKVRQVAKGLEVVGDLSIHGVTKEVVLKVEGPTSPRKNPWGKDVVGVEAETSIKRTDFGLKWNKALEAGGLLVGEEVRILIELELNQD